MRRPAPVARIRAQWRTDRAFVALATLVLLAYVAARLGLVWRFPPFVDETEYADWSLGIFRDPAHPMLSLRFGKEPLTTWLAAAPISLGFNPLTGIRLVSAASGLVAMIAVGGIAGRLAGRWAGLAAAGVYAVVPFAFVQTSIGLYEPLVTALLCTALWLQLRLAERPSQVAGLALGLVMGAALLTKDTGKLAVVLLPLSALCLPWRTADRRHEIWAWAQAALLAVAVVAGAYELLRISPGFGELAGLRRILLRSYESGVGHPLHWLSTNWAEDRDTLHGYLTLPIVALGAVGIAVATYRRPRQSLVVLAWMAAAWLAVVLLAKTQFPRYFAPFVALLAVFAGVGVHALARVVLQAVPGRAGVTGACVLVVALAWPAARFDVRVVKDPGRARYPGGDYSQYVSSNYAGTGVPEIARALKRRLPERDAVVLYQGPWNWGLPLLTEGRDAPVEQSYANNVYQTKRVRYVLLEVLPTDLGSAPGRRRFFVVLNGNYELPHGLRDQVRLVRDFIRPKEGIHVYLYEQR